MPCAIQGSAQNQQKARQRITACHHRQIVYERHAEQTCGLRIPRQRRKPHQHCSRRNHQRCTQNQNALKRQAKLGQWPQKCIPQKWVSFVTKLCKDLRDGKVPYDAPSLRHIPPRVIPSDTPKLHPHIGRKGCQKQKLRPCPRFHLHIYLQGKPLLSK